MSESKLQIPSILEKYEADIKATKKSFIKIITTTNDKLTIEDSKVGGIPYWPKEKELVKFGDQKGKLMAQINFSKLKEEGILLENYPTKGMLQFFTAPGDDMWGLDGDTYKVIYHEDLTLEHSNDEEMIEISLENEGMPFHSSLELKFSKEEEYLGLLDSYNQNLYSINFDGLNEKEEEAFYDLSNTGSKIGGYAYFTQEDPRTYDVQFKSEDEWLLLFQLDSDSNLMWGDCGVGNWFIKKEDLINKNFDNVFFTWDCC